MKKLFLAGTVCLLSLIGKAQVREGAMAPEISLPNVKDSIVSLSSFKGKVVLVDFWASWCGPCRASNPHVARLYKKYKDRGFEVFGVSVDEEKADWVKAIRQDKLKYTQVMAGSALNNKTTQKYGVELIPATFLLDKSGKIVAMDIDGKELENKIKELLQ